MWGNLFRNSEIALIGRETIREAAFTTSMAVPDYLKMG
jgi:hypothetical protein